jgi:hypothetical protein
VTNRNVSVIDRGLFEDTVKTFRAGTRKAIRVPSRFQASVVPAVPARRTRFQLPPIPYEAAVIHHD